MGFKAVAKHAPVIFSAHFTAGEAADKQVFTADRYYELLEVIEVHRIVGAASSTLMIEKTASGVAPASGVDLLAAAFLTDSTVDIPVRKHIANGGLVASAVSRTLAPGDSLSADFTGTITAYEGAITFVLRPIPGLGAAY
jgi:hypothetical protein